MNLSKIKQPTLISFTLLTEWDALIHHYLCKQLATSYQRVYVLYQYTCKCKNRCGFTDNKWFSDM